ncbi:coiled-coil domain-containing protein [Anaeroselena agilis]|uniref:Peptidoglycan hydrolase PcsB coiled-coil domain-containing protein n=1 Tax=Anaeroselena agilis TaxID=3063788 RepID=A0ABU3P002_9FIRM|nr:hypothetical protein [Selenomonadales bacterium 4137-cl]
MEKTEKGPDSHTQMLNKRMRDFYMYGQVSYFDILVGASDLSDFSTRYDFLRRILQPDAELIAKTMAERESIAQKKELERAVVAIQELRKVAVEKRMPVASRYQGKRSMLDDLESQKDEADGPTFTSRSASTAFRPTYRGICHKRQKEQTDGLFAL